MWLCYLPESFQAVRQALPRPHCTEDIGKVREITDLSKVAQPELRLDSSDFERKAASARGAAEICDVQSGRTARNSVVAPFVRCVSTLQVLKRSI